MLKIPVGIAGSGYLAWLAWDSWRAASEDDTTVTPTASADAMRSGVVLSLSNPQNRLLGGAAVPSAPSASAIRAARTTPSSSAASWPRPSSGALSAPASSGQLFGGRGRVWRVWTYRVRALAFGYLAIGTAWQVIQLLFGDGSSARVVQSSP